MSLRPKHGWLLIVIAVMALFLMVVYGNAAVIQYIYDENGNLIGKSVQTSDTTPPTTTASPVGGTYKSAQTVSLIPRMKPFSSTTGLGTNQTH